MPQKKPVSKKPLAKPKRFSTRVKATMQGTQRVLDVLFEISKTAELQQADQVTLRKIQQRIVTSQWSPTDFVNATRVLKKYLRE